MAIAEYSSVVPLSPQELFQFLFQDGAWERGIPAEMSAERLEDGPFREGSRLHWRISWKGFQFTWGIVIESIRAPDKIEVHQSLGMFNFWSLTQELEDHGSNSTLLNDIVEYELPLGLLGKLADDLIVRSEIKRLLESRHEKIRDLIEKRKAGE